MSETFYNQLRIFKKNSPKHLQNWKKIWALVNFAKTIQDFDEWESLEFLIRSFFKGFLKPGRQALLDEIIEEYQIDYTKWAVKDAWVKMQQINGFKCRKGTNQLEFWFEGLEKEIVDSRYKWPVYSKLERYKLIYLEN